MYDRVRITVKPCMTCVALYDRVRITVKPCMTCVALYDRVRITVKVQNVDCIAFDDLCVMYY